MRRSKKRLTFLLFLFLFLFLAMVVYLSYFQVFRASSLRSHPFNMRNWVDESKFGRGLFYDRKGLLLTNRTKKEDGSYARSNKYPNLYSHIIGYNSKQYGKTALEASLNADLLNMNHENALAQLRGQILNEGVGNDVHLTLDHGLQMRAYQLMKGKKGALVAVNPKTGEVLAMISSPSFDTNRLKSEWDDLVQDADGRLFNRACQGLYTPGSVMKALTSYAILEEGIDLSYEDKGTTTIDGYTIGNVNKNAYGKIGMREALMHSSNVYFADKSQQLSEKTLQDTMKRFGFYEKLPFSLPTSICRASFEKGMAKTLKASNAFGQGDVLVNPLTLCMDYAAIANGGKLLQPLLVQSITSPQNSTVRVEETRTLQTLNSEYCRQISSYLKDTARQDGFQDALPNMALCGKTGTAQTKEEKTHSWFCGYGPYEDPELCVTIVLEDANVSGAAGAMPIVSKIFDYWFNNR